MSNPTFDIVILGLSITSSWGNGHATTYRGLVRELTRRGHRVLFLERDVPWYADTRDEPDPSYCRTALYGSVEELKDQYCAEVRKADVVIVGSYVKDGVEVGNWVSQTARGVTAFYDIDTPVTLSKLDRGDYEYLAPEQISQYDLYLSFTGGPTLKKIEQQFGSPCARPLYCSVDPALYRPMEAELRWDLAYMGTYSDDRQPGLNELMLQCTLRWSKGRFCVVGPQYPETIRWPANVQRIEHLPPAEHPLFYNSQRFTLNITRADMKLAGYCPSVRLFEAAACGTPIISDRWNGLEDLFEIGREILISRNCFETYHLLLDLPEQERRAIGERARSRVLAHHTATHRAAELENYILAVNSSHSIALQA